MAGTENDVNGKLCTGFISGRTFVNRPVQYYDVDGIALFEGDIELGSTEEVEQQTAACRAASLEPGIAQNVTTAPDLRWPKAVVPFEIAPDLPNQQTLREAIAHLQDYTVVDFVPRSVEADYVRFVYHPSVNDSRIGRVGGEQLIRLTDNFDRGTVLHEMLHCLGVWHEHSRPDRDQFVRILWENIHPDKVGNFDQTLNDNHDVGGYDYNSIMHYPRDAFSTGDGDTIVPLDPNAQIGQREGLSPLDVDAVRFLYAPWAFSKPPTTIVPDLTGQDGAGVINLLGAAGLRAVWFEQYSATVERGKVISQDVAPGSEWPSGSPIPVTISLGPDPNPQTKLEPSSKNVLDKNFMDIPLKLDPYTRIQGPDWRKTASAIPFTLSTEYADAGTSPQPGQVTPTLVVHLEKVLETLTWANTVHTLSPADKECWAGIAAVYARLVASLAESST